MAYEHLRPVGIMELEKNGLTDSGLLIDLEKRVKAFVDAKEKQEQNQKQLKEKGKSGKLGGLL